MDGGILRTNLGKAHQSSGGNSIGSMIVLRRNTMRLARLLVLSARSVVHLKAIHGGPETAAVK